MPVASPVPAPQAGRRGAPPATREQMAEVVAAIRQTPIIDHHAHPLMKLHAVGQHELLSIISEAHGAALDHAVTTFAFHRAVKQLAAVLGCAPSWEAVLAAIDERRRQDYGRWTRTCLGGIETLLLDDGLDNAQDTLDLAQHDGFTRSPSRRIVRIEAVAADLMGRHIAAALAEAEKDQAGLNASDILDAVLQAFDAEIRSALADPLVVGFKSIICYRTGLDVPRQADMVAARTAFFKIVKDCTETGQRFRRLQHAGLNELVVHRTAALIRDASSHKPIQFHTGLGDNDITLTRASPAHLQNFIRSYPTVPVVLLHSGYPHMRDTAYLASTYANVYADIGEVFPFVSRDGQETILREILELCPWSKLLWSTDGHWFPETYLIAVQQVRQGLETVLCEFVDKGDIGWQSAVELVQDVLFRNANKIYQLGLSLPAPAPAPTSDAVVRHGHMTGQLSPSAGRDVWEAFLSEHARPDFVRLSWLDYGKPRMRMVPFQRFNRLVCEGKPLDIGITKAALGLLQNDMAIEGVEPSGEYRLHPDLSTLRAGPIPGHANLYGNFREPDGSPVPLCPRTHLQAAVEASAQQGYTHLIGFEIEFLLMQRDGSPDKTSGSRYSTLPNDGHSWSTSRFFVDPAVPELMRAVVQDLAEAGIEVEQMHAESAPGQFELVLPAKPPVEAVDDLLLARETMAARAVAAGLQFTLHPKPYENACGTAAHMHLSLQAADGLEGSVGPAVYESFYAGVLQHLRAVIAFTYSNPASYLRMVDSFWAGGRWVTWGRQNREVPLRQVAESHWEFKSMDGLANPYLAVAALLRAGQLGVAAQTPLTWRNCSADPALLSAEERGALGITQMLPADVEEALGALTADKELVEALGAAVVERYVGFKKSELAMLSGLANARDWIIGQY